MINRLRTCSGRFFNFDSDKLCFAAGVGDETKLSFGLNEFLRFSNTKPWVFPPLSAMVFSAKQDKGLSIHAENELFGCELSFAFDAELLICKVQTKLKKDAACSFAAVSIPVPDDAVLTIPANLYNNNPSTSPERQVQRFSAQGKASLLLETSRIVLPGINAEFNGTFLSLFNTQVPKYGEPECTMGFHRDEPGKTQMMLTTGALSFCGEKDVFFAAKLTTEPILQPYPEMRSNDTMELQFALSWGNVSQQGHGFRDLAQSAYQIFKPRPEPALSLEKVIELKVAALHERWGLHGYWCVLPGNLHHRNPYYLYGWTGQSFRLALCDMRNALAKGETAGIDRAMECVRFFLDGSKTAVPGLRNNLFRSDNLSWGGDVDAQQRTIHSSRALGETWSDLARILLVCREHKLPEPEGALEALKEGLQFFLDHRLKEGVPPMMWFDDGTPASAELTCAGSSILPGFFDLWQLTGKEYWKEQAEAMLELFWQIGGNDFRTPFSHATLDAACEDKESGIPVFNAAVKAWKLTGNPRCKEYAEVIGDWLLTWVCFTDLPLRPGSICAEHDFRTVGWPTVSIENQHLDVFFPAWELYEFGRDTGIERFREMGKVIFAAWSHGISQGGGDWMFQNPGRQAEQFYHTNWSANLRSILENPAEPMGYYYRLQGYTPDNFEHRIYKGAANPWDVSWIIALVLDAAQNFQAESINLKA